MIAIMIGSFLPSPFDRLSARNCRELALAEGETLFHQGDPTRAMFLIVAGGVDLMRHTQSGREVRIFRAHAGDTLAEAALFSDRYHCRAVAVGVSRVISLDRTALRDLIARDSDFAMAMTARMARQVQSYRRRLEVNAMRRATDRIEALLSDGWPGDDLTGLAREAGLTQEATYRGLARLVARGRAQKLGRGHYRLCAAQTPAARKANGKA